MKYLLIAFLLSTNYAYAADNNIEKLLEKANRAIPYYGETFYGKTKAQIVKISKNTSWLIHQARYGGDGEHSENILMIFELYEHPSERIMKRSNNVNKIIQYSISNVKFTFSGEYLSKISGEIIETLCDVCDGWEVSSPGDIFQIPIEIYIPSLIIRPTLSSAEAKGLLSKLDKKATANIKEQLGYGNETQIMSQRSLTALMDYLFRITRLIQPTQKTARLISVVRLNILFDTSIGKEYNCTYENNSRYKYLHCGCA